MADDLTNESQAPVSPASPAEGADYSSDAQQAASGPAAPYERPRKGAGGYARHGAAGGHARHGATGGHARHGAAGGKEGRTGPEGRDFPGRREPGEVDDVVVKIYRCAKVVRGGRRFSFGALVVVGDRLGKVGIGYGKANEVPSAVEKAAKAARRNMIPVKIEGTTIPHQVTAKYRSSKVVLVPAGGGTGVIAGASVRALMELAGVKDVLTKCYGSSNPKNLVKAAFEALCSLRSKDEVARLREVPLAGAALARE